jgi:hypothetical protein
VAVEGSPNVCIRPWTLSAIPDDDPSLVAARGERDMLTVKAERQLPHLVEGSSLRNTVDQDGPLVVCAAAPRHFPAVVAGNIFLVEGVAGRRLFGDEFLCVGGAVRVLRCVRRGLGSQLEPGEKSPGERNGDHTGKGVGHGCAPR